MTLQRFQDREALIVREADAVSVNWRRARAVNSAPGDALAAAVAAYLDARLDQLAAGNAGLHHGAAALPAERLRARLWPLTEAATAPIATTPLAVSVMAATEDTLNVSRQRDAAFHGHLPPMVTLLLFGYLLTTGYILGYVLGASERRHLIATSVLFVLVTAAIMLVVDLDRPFDGSLELDNTPLLELQAEIRGVSGR